MRFLQADCVLSEYAGTKIFLGRVHFRGMLVSFGELGNLHPIIWEMCIGSLVTKR